MGVAEYIKTRRLQKARRLLEEGDYSVTQVSDMLGYCSICYFSSEFKNQFGKNPSDYVKDFRSKGERNPARGENLFPYWIKRKNAVRPQNRTAFKRSGN